MKYISTRGHVAPQGFIDTVLMGLADDGGLMIPEKIPHVSAATLKEWSTLSYKELFLQIFSLYTNEEIPNEDLKEMVDKSYASFRSPEVTPVKQLNDSLYILELFHGPTFAFKDVALQFMGEFYSYVSKKQNKIIHILGATSGDTGAAAIQGVRGKEGIKICILHPHEKVSKVQELQMTTVDDKNVLNLSVKGNFDDCQKLIKEQFADLDFKSKHNLRAINSINFVRILAQSVYYFYAYFQIEQGDQPKKVNVSVPSGNFGNIFSGFLAKMMGLPIHKLIIATNENNILERFVKSGEYKPGEFKSTHSPSMDIQVASNFERYLYYFLGQDAQKVSAYMKNLQNDGEIVISAEDLVRVQNDFEAHGASNEEGLQLISTYKAEYDYLLDPHTACGVAAYEACNGEDEICISFATAHPAKFNEAIEQCDIEQAFPTEIEQLFAKPQHQLVIDHNKEEIVKELVAFYER
ncbi:threonine synthase [Paenibacillus macquariensis]|uniref:Threonine synthase n=1 Tax=Paenibacillus macquariensis TaxID=948756 RepID=A0ABY1K335_9BACL|nr:threonine synthase [Paenibacillus macquariensis]MEC0090316.1 threonine synthase [Paenibacillus macquariensis]OAB39673.1 threonine synthase [Paenibacillus macquariensis subsp. macquariensis]SIR19336.1 threonine synthase [Paenibacillus macquariensis]